MSRIFPKKQQKKKPAKQKVPRVVPTSHALAKMRRDHGGVWKLTYAVEGYDQHFVQYVGRKISRPFAIAVGARAIATACDVSVQDVYLSDVEEE